MVRFADIVDASRAVSATRARSRKVEALTACLRRASTDELPLAVAYLSGELPQGRVGVGRALWTRAQTSAAAEPSWSVLDVHRQLEAIAEISGAGSIARRAQALGRLLAGATREEQRFLAGLFFGELRQGALEGLMLEAIGRATGLELSAVRRAWLLAGDLGAVASSAARDGEAGLRAFRVTPFRPLRPMLAQPADDVDDALARHGTTALELKLDGARVQVHRVGDEVRIFSRGMNDVTAALPEVVAAALALPARELVLDGEAIALRENGRPHPFQATMRRFGRKADAERLRATLPISPFFFDLLYLDGDELWERPLGERLAALDELVPASVRVERLVTGEPDAASGFVDRALTRGHEGAMAKALDAPYDAGGRGRAWLKIKSAHTLDLVVLAAEWGSGRRRGWLSNLHLGARDTEGGGFAMLGKTFKGLSDEVLAWQTEALLARAVDRDGAVVRVRPELVVETAFNDVQTSPVYDAGLALRFARVIRYRHDKHAGDADTLDAVRQLHRAALG